MDRAQAHTLEAFTAAILLVAGLIFASQATAVTPLSASTSNQHIENQHRAMANDLLRTTVENGSLSEAILYWNTNNGGFHDASQGYYTSDEEFNDTGLAFAESLARTFGDRSVAYNVDIQYCETDSETDDVSCDQGPQEMVNMGSPSDNAATATRTVTLFNDTEISGGPAEDETLENVSEEFYAPYASNRSDTLYNVVEVRIVLWKM